MMNLITPHVKSVSLSKDDASKKIIFLTMPTLTDKLHCLRQPEDWQMGIAWQERTLLWGI